MLKVSKMKVEYFPPREDVFLQNEAPTDFYILVTVVVKLLVRKIGVDHVVGEAKVGDLCGEIGVLCYRPQLFTVRTERLCQVLRLNRTTFLNIDQANVGDGTIIMNNLLQEQHLKGMDDPILEEVLTETLNMLTHGQMDLPLNLCSAALGGDDLLLHQLLKKGHNANESDNNGRTPQVCEIQLLVLLRPQSSKDCAANLLNYSADPNCKDSEESVPLWEVIGKWWRIDERCSC
ncbi:hypothetical protein F3Y22_tig00117048pilonHSYRG01394 [Hibiscus syriacus]|uniref:Potassium channel n=1 Tax=Hibiscus syriacus TaxID=106335 RepID=A0A6A2WY91_HIBSY|nr:hypothetical protein F3Y22_tig00117048pilonHSYRG01394 [Hibiscus syriacus]